MRSAKKVVMALCLGLAFSAAAWAQGMMGRGPQAPQMLGMLNPMVGSGAEYQMTAKGKDMDIAWVILGKEDVAGSTGYWMEIRTTSAEMGGETVMKQLTVSQGPEVGVKRMIMQSPGHPPMEMPMGMMSGMMRQQQHEAPAEKGGKPDMGENLGTESVTVPAGTFTCQHYRKQEKSGPVDYWISTRIAPMGVVKMTSAETTMLLKKVLTNETSHIKGEPQKMKMPEMPHF